MYYLACFLAGAILGLVGAYLALILGADYFLTGPEPENSMKTFLRLLTSKTVWGTVATVGAWLSQQPVIDKTTIVKGIGAVLMGTGVAHKLDKIADAASGTTPN